MPARQYQLLIKDGFSVPTYLSRTFDGVARYSHLRSENYFYYNCLKGCFLKDNCPAYLKKRNFEKLQDGMVDQLRIVNGTFNSELAARKYSKVG